MARTKAMGYSGDVLWRGDATGKLPNEYPGGAFFSREKDYAAGFAQKGGQPDPREFRLDLSKAFTIGKPITAGKYGRLVESAMAHDPQLAAQLARQFDVQPEYMVGFGKTLKKRSDHKSLSPAERLERADALRRLRRAKLMGTWVG